MKRMSIAERTLTKQVANMQDQIAQYQKEITLIRAASDAIFNQKLVVEHEINRLRINREHASKRATIQKGAA